MNKKLKEYLIITLGFIIVALGLTVFLIPSNLAVGGVTGLSLIIHTHFNFLSVGFLLILINSILFIIAFFTLGPAFGAKSIYASLGLSGAIWFIQRLFPGMKPLTDDLFINLVFGMLVSSTGMSLVLYQNASTGGTDILAKILNKFLHVPIGRSLLFVDFFITILAGLTFGPRLGLYALLGVIMNGMIIDNMKRIFEVADSSGFLDVTSKIHINIVPEINLTKDKLVLFQPDCFLIRRHHEIISSFNDGLARVGRYYYEELKPEQMEAFFAKCHKIGEIFYFKSNNKLFRIQTKENLTL